MSRKIGELEPEIDKQQLNPFFALAIGLPDPVFVWTGVGNLVFAGDTFLGTGAFGTLGTIGEGSDGSAIGMTATLSGIAPDLSDDILTQPYRGASFMVYVGALADDFKKVTAQPKLLWRGKVDTVQLSDGDTLEVTITAESRMRDQGRPRIKRYTDRRQQSRFPGDKFFEFLPALAEINMVWGKSA